MDGYLVGKKIVILGSGDIGLIMARRMSLEGADVLAVCELMPYSNGLNRNIVQCLNDFNIPLYLSHTVTDIISTNGRVSKVVVSKVDDKLKPIIGSEIEFECDTLLLSVGLIPENELSKEANIKIDRRTNGPIVFENNETSIEGIFACGNVLHVHDLVDYVSAEAASAGSSAAKYLKNNKLDKGRLINIVNGNLVNYTVPQMVRINNVDDKLNIFFRVRTVMDKKVITIRSNNELIKKEVKLHLAPSEMESIKLTKEQLEKCNDEIIISVEDL